MRAVVQRVSSASVKILDAAPAYVSGKIAAGLVVLVAVENGDDIQDARYLAGKIANLRIFEDGEQKMNLSAKDKNAQILVVSQFTLFGNVRKGTRPSFNRSAPPQVSLQFYNDFLSALSEALGRPVEAGKFGAYMALSLVNDGPVTIILDSKNKDI